MSKLWAKYKSGTTIGTGEHSSVRILIRKSDGKRFACKSTCIDRAGNKEECSITMKRVQVEAECLIKMCDHPGVLNYEELIMEPDAWHLILELCDCSLADLIHERGGKLPEVEAALLLVSLASTLSDIHSAGIIHRDIKPDNILISRDSCSPPSGGSSDLSPNPQPYGLKLADFGVAQCLNSSMRQCKRLRDKVGTPRYVAPEVVSGSYWLPADVWSLGVTFYHMLAGEGKVFGEYSTVGLLSDLKVCVVDLETSLDWEGISSGAKDLIQRMMDKNPYKRPKASDVVAHPWVQAALAAAAHSNLQLTGLHL